MTLQHIILRHWWKIILAAIAAPLIIAFGYMTPDETPIGGVPVKYIAAIIAGIGAYTVMTVKNALAQARKPNTNTPATRVAPKQPVNEEEDVFSQFGGQ